MDTVSTQWREDFGSPFGGQTHFLCQTVDAGHHVIAHALWVLVNLHPGFNAFGGGLGPLQKFAAQERPLLLNPLLKRLGNWAQGGPIIEREGINLSVDYQDSALSNDMVQIGWKGNLWNNSVPGTAGFLQWAYGPTPLIAAMRCFCVSKLGTTVEVPEELT